MRLHSLGIVCVLVVASTACALAQPSTSGAASPTPADQPSKAVPNLQQTITQDLSKAGFKDISVSPATFNVHATNSSGQKVFMLIGPESLTEIVTSQASKSAPPSAGNAPSTK